MTGGSLSLAGSREDCPLGATATQGGLLTDAVVAVRLQHPVDAGTCEGRGKR